VNASLLVTTAGIARADKLGHSSGAVSSSPGPHAVFLSYASQDAEAARRICEALRAAGIEVWFDRSELRGGDAWDQSIRRQIRECADGPQCSAMAPLSLIKKNRFMAPLKEDPRFKAILRQMKLPE
jgi:hypothetical protein